MKNLFYKDISTLKEFDKFGDHFIQTRHNPDTGWYLYERCGNGRTSFEIVKGMKRKNPDGSIVYSYPNTESWGTYGYTIDNNCFAEDLINFIMSAPIRTAEEIHQFKIGL